MIPDESSSPDENPSTAVTGTVPPTGRLQAALACRADIRTAAVHAGLVDGKPTLVYRRGFRQRDPAACRALIGLAMDCGFTTREDRRAQRVPVRRDRRRALPALALAGLVLGSAAAADDGGAASRPAAAQVQALDPVQVTAERPDPGHSGRLYRVDSGKRYVTDPYGDSRAILNVAADVRAHGVRHRVSTRGMVLPQTVVDHFINRYDYTFPARCGGGTFSYYETGGFSALGYHLKGKVVLDALAGGAFAGPRLWGPYDQVLGGKVDMEMLFGDGRQDGMGLLKAAYYIGQTPVMSDERYERLGHVYETQVKRSAECGTGAGVHFAARASGTDQVASNP